MNDNNILDHNTKARIPFYKKLPPQVLILEAIIIMVGLIALFGKIRAILRYDLDYFDGTLLSLIPTALVLLHYWIDYSASAKSIWLEIPLTCLQIFVFLMGGLLLIGGVVACPSF